MLGHEVRYSETNDGDWVPLCACGWIGNVHRAVITDYAKSKRHQRVVELTKIEAKREHHRHLEDVREATAAEHAKALDSHAGYLAAVGPTLRRIGRWGNG